MKDIPRNELLDKLADGWKVRIKNDKFYVEGNTNNLKSLFELKGMDIVCLIDRAWEGIPHTPKLNYQNLDIKTAFKCLTTGAAFIRRADRGDAKLTLRDCDGGVLRILLVDILANDWEVWG